jgi:glycosyltransferase involved in cell wall biosynthesis
MSARQPVLSVVILTHDEESNLPACLASLRALDAEIFVVDSGSTDRTLAIAGEAGCRVDEHMIVDRGRTLRLDHDIVDENRKGLTFWTDKHNRYADREVQDLLALEERATTAGELGDQPGSRRWLKENLYARSPLFWRAFAYWLYRYVLRLGFLDGRPGLVFHFLQGFWYRFLVDAKLCELKRRT